MSSGHQRYKHYDLDFKRRAVDLLKSSGRSISEVALELGIPYKTLERWKGQLGRPAISDPGAPGSLEEAASQLAELRTKLADVELERDILKKALAICSREEIVRRRSS